MTCAVCTPTLMSLATVSKRSSRAGTDVSGVKNIARVCPRMILFSHIFCGPQIPFRFAPFLILKSGIKHRVHLAG